MRYSYNKEKRTVEVNKWTMPKWMEPYRHLIVNTGGNTVEELLSTNTDVNVNSIRARLEVGVDSQVVLLEKLHNRGLLVEEDRTC